MNRVTVIGAGLAGCEAAWQLAERGINVALIEMKPLKKSEAHYSNDFAEIVCSNSLKNNEITNACGLLKEELRKLNSLLINAADNCRVEAGAALAVDRDKFSHFVTEKIKNHPNIEIINEVADSIPLENTIIATGPLTDDALIKSIEKLTGRAFLHFFDAAAPIITKESIDFDSAFYASRYNKGSADYINCPMDKEEYQAFYEALISAETAEVRDFENSEVFEGCMPIEVMAQRGIDTLRFGPLKPVGLIDPRNNKKNYAVLQLRKETISEEMYNLVGFQTHLLFKEQKRVFSLIPALKNAEFIRYGVMHKNTFINSPGFLDENYRVKDSNNIYFAGQITGVEGYVESIASGMTAALDMYKHINCGTMLKLRPSTMMGALGNYIANASPDNFQPMNSNFAILPPLMETIKNKEERKQKYAERALCELGDIIREQNL